MSNALAAVVFDVDGTLVDSEQRGHRIAFNEAFEAFGIEDRWDVELYRQLLAIAGGERRLRHWFDDPRSSLSDRPAPEKAALAASLHRWKTQRFEEIAASGEIPERPGVTALLDSISDHGIALGVATTGTRQWVAPLLEVRFGPERFSCIVTGDDVDDLKPAPAAYLLALQRLGIASSSCIAIEDSGPGMAAAHNAALRCVVVANDDTDLSSVASADLLVTGYEPDGAVILSDPWSISDGPGLTVDILRRLAIASRREDRNSFETRPSAPDLPQPRR
jgi:HAD superfamily hydrolase (TIGR01509 family)